MPRRIARRRSEAPATPCSATSARAASSTSSRRAGVLEAGPSRRGRGFLPAGAPRAARCFGTRNLYRFEAPEGSSPLDHVREHERVAEHEHEEDGHERQERRNEDAERAELEQCDERGERDADLGAEWITNAFGDGHWLPPDYRVIGYSLSLDSQVLPHVGREMT